MTPHENIYAKFSDMNTYIPDGGLGVASVRSNINCNWKVKKL